MGISWWTCLVAFLLIVCKSVAAAELTDAGQAQAEDLHVMWSDNSTYKTITGDLPTKAVVSPLSR